MQPTPLSDDAQLLALLKAKLDALAARRPEVSDPQELAHLGRQYRAILLTLIELGEPLPLNLNDEDFHVPEPDYNLYDRLIFSAQHMPDLELQRLMWNQAGYLVRTPLSVIKTTAYLLSRGANGTLSEKQASYIQHITEQVDHLYAAFERMLSDARVKMEEWQATEAPRDSPAGNDAQP